jgi:hypothetical protein
MTELMHPDAARLSSTSVHRTVADATHQSLIDDKERRDSIEPRHGEVVTAVQTKRG